MDRFNTPTSDSGDCDVAPAAIVDTLQDVISDVDSFVSDWCKRLEQVVASCDRPQNVEAKPADENLRKQIEDFQQEKSRWESKRKLEELQIQQKASQLTEAWLRLETEQRLFLQMKETHPHTSRDCAPAEVDRSLAENQAPIDLESPKRSISASVHPSREAAVRQFQRLRREIESSRPNSGQL